MNREKELHLIAKYGGVFTTQRKIAGQHTFIMGNTGLKKTAFMLLKEVENSMENEFVPYDEIANIINSMMINDCKTQNEVMLLNKLQKAISENRLYLDGLNSIKSEK